MSEKNTGSGALEAKESRLPAYMRPAEAAKPAEGGSAAASEDCDAACPLPEPAAQAAEDSGMEGAAPALDSSKDSAPSAESPEACDTACPLPSFLTDAPASAEISAGASLAPGVQKNFPPASDASIQAASASVENASGAETADPAGSSEGPAPSVGATPPSVGATPPSVGATPPSVGATPPSAGDGFFKTHPVVRAESALPPSFSSRLFNSLAWLPVFFLVLMLAGQTVFSLNARALWFSDEVRHAAAYEEFLHNGLNFILQMNGANYPDKPPLYFWFLRGLQELTQFNGPTLFFAGAAVSALLYLVASLGLARLVGRADGRGTLASGIVLLTAGYMVGLMHYARMDLLFSCAILLSQIALYHALIRRQSFFFSFCAFFCAGLAVLIKGPLGIAFPLATALCFVIWQGRPFRLLKPDMLFGLFIACLTVGVWAAGVWYESGKSFDFLLNDVLGRQVVERAVETFHHKEPWHYYLVRLPLMFLPWTLLVFCLPWERLASKTFLEGLAASRRREGEGTAWLWCMALSAVALLSVLSGKILIYYLPALPAVCILAGRAVLRLSGRRAQLFRDLNGVFFLLGGVALTVASLMLFGVIPAPDVKGVPAWTLPLNAGFFITAACLLLTAGMIWLVQRSPRPEGLLLVLALGCTGTAYPLAVMVSPSFDAVMSPKAQSEIIKKYIAEGFEPMSYRDYGGTYTYYAGSRITEFREHSLLSQRLDAGGKVILAVRETHWEEWPAKPEGCAEVNRQWIESKEMLLLACTPPPPPAPEPPAAVMTEQPETPAEGRSSAYIAVPEGVSPAAPAGPPATNGTQSVPAATHNGTSTAPARTENGTAQ